MASVEVTIIKNRIRDMALPVLSEKGGEESIIRLMKKIHDTVEAYLSETMTLEEKSLVACRRGCCHCCRVTVPVLLPEAVVIASYLRRNMDSDSLNALTERMNIFCHDIAAYDEEERIAANKPCVFLGKDGECTVHSVRPFACRAVISADDDACRRAMQMPLFDDYVYIPMNITHKSVTDSAFIGLAEAMDALGISSRSFEITSQVLKLLT